MGRKPDREEVAVAAFRVRLTLAERRDLDSVARENHSTVSAVLRDAVNDYVADYRERAVFVKRR